MFYQGCLMKARSTYNERVSMRLSGRGENVDEEDGECLEEARITQSIEALKSQPGFFSDLPIAALAHSINSAEESQQFLDKMCDIAWIVYQSENQQFLKKLCYKHRDGRTRAAQDLLTLENFPRTIIEVNKLFLSLNLANKYDAWNDKNIGMVDRVDDLIAICFPTLLEKYDKQHALSGKLESNWYKSPSCRIVDTLWNIIDGIKCAKQQQDGTHPETELWSLDNFKTTLARRCVEFRAPSVANVQEVFVWYSEISGMRKNRQPNIWMPNIRIFNIDFEDPHRGRSTRSAHTRRRRVVRSSSLVTKAATAQVESEFPLAPMGINNRPFFVDGQLGSSQLGYSSMNAILLRSMIYLSYHHSLGASPKERLSTMCSIYVETVTAPCFHSYCSTNSNGRHSPTVVPHPADAGFRVYFRQFFVSPKQFGEAIRRVHKILQLLPVGSPLNPPTEALPPATKSTVNAATQCFPHPLLEAPLPPKDDRNEMDFSFLFPVTSTTVKAWLLDLERSGEPDLDTGFCRKTIRGSPRGRTSLSCFFLGRFLRCYKKHLEKQILHDPKLIGTQTESCLEELKTAYAALPVESIIPRLQ